MEQKIINDISAEIALFMYNVGITTASSLSSFKDDQKALERLFKAHITAPDVLALKSVSDEVYLRILGMHAFGAGAYIAAKEQDLSRPVSEFTDAEMDGIFSDFDSTDAYELGLKKLNIPLDSGNRKMLDRVIVIGIKEIKQIAKEKAAEPENIKAFMQVLFNAGISVYKQRK